MTGWVRFENTTPENMKVAPVGDKAFRLWFNASCYCSRAGGDVLSPLTLHCLAPPKSASAAVRELLEAGLIVAVVDGYRILGPWHASRTRRRIPRWLRAAVVKRDGQVCQLCGGPVESSDLHIDHVIPVARGGGDSLSNLQVAHSTCNISKGARI